MGRREALELARGARRLLVKVGPDTLRFGPERPMSAEEAARYLVHEDGLLRVPVLVRGDLLVRGYTDTLYREALADDTPSGGAAA